MLKQRSLRFPNGFLWGNATSSHQNEGGNGNNQWYRWEQQGRILTGEHAGDAANWWQMAEDDFDRAEQMENNALRLSIEWSRVEPTEGQWDSAAIERYRSMLQDLYKRHIKPIVTLHHFTEPLWFADRGGFANEANIRFFVRYVEHVVAVLRDLCDFWITINEPNVYATQSYLFGTYPPGEQDMTRTFQVLRNLMWAHVQAFYAIRRVQPQGRIGYCLHYRLFDPAIPFLPLIASLPDCRKPSSTGRHYRPERLAISRFHSTRSCRRLLVRRVRVIFMASITIPARWCALTPASPPNCSGIAIRAAALYATIRVRKVILAKSILPVCIA